MVTQYI